MTFCYEEYMPILSLIDEAAYDHNMVVVLSNLWATKDPLSSLVQGAHTQGMALLFGRRWVRAVNYVYYSALLASMVSIEPWIFAPWYRARLAKRSLPYATLLLAIFRVFVDVICVNDATAPSSPTLPKT